MAGHTKATIDDFDLGAFRAMILSGDSKVLDEEPIDM